MDDARGVGLGQPVGDLGGVSEGFAELEPPAADKLVEGSPVDVFHDDEIQAAVGDDVVDDDDVRVIEGRGGFGLLDEPLLPLGIGHLVVGRTLMATRRSRCAS